MLHHCIEEVVEKNDEQDKEKDNDKEKDKEKEKEKENIYNSYQSVAVMAIGLIAGSEEVGNDMALRTMSHLLQYGEITVRRAVPLALASLNLSNPKITVMDLLTKLCHDPDAELSQRAILSLGLIGCGTNNSRYMKFHLIKILFFI